LEDENVVDDSEEQSLYVVGNYHTHKKQMMQFKREIQDISSKKTNKNLVEEKKTQTDPIEGNFQIIEEKLKI